MQIPHYHLEDATNAAKKVMGPYYREPVKSPGWFPSHLIEPLVRSFQNDHYVEDTGEETVIMQLLAYCFVGFYSRLLIMTCSFCR